MGSEKYWNAAIGLQDVDGLKPSRYLLDMVKENIEGNIDIEEVAKRINNYYEEVDNLEKEKYEEADKVSVRIAKLLCEDDFELSSVELMNIHKKLFDGLMNNAGEYRNYDFTKKEWVLNNDTVVYSSYEKIKENLDYDFSEEMKFSYENLSIDDYIKHLCKFISNIWQVHPFSEGNTRTTALFLIKYLRTFGFDINYDVFCNNSWYFRNALVRANYKNYDKNIHDDLSYLEKFLYNLLTNSNYELKNRYLHVDFTNSDYLMKKNCSLEQQAILNIIRIDSDITQDEIALRIGKSIRSVKTYMSNMQKNGLIKRINGKRNGKWIINI